MKGHISKSTAALFAVIALLARCARRHRQHSQSHSIFRTRYPGRRDGPHHHFAPIVKRAMPAVVNISSSKVVKDQGEGGQGLFNDPFFRQFFGGRMPQDSRNSRVPSAPLAWARAW